MRTRAVTLSGPIRMLRTIVSIGGRVPPCAAIRRWISASPHCENQSGRGSAPIFTVKVGSPSLAPDACARMLIQRKSMGRLPVSVSTPSSTRASKRLGLKPCVTIAEVAASSASASVSSTGSPVARLCRA